MATRGERWAFWLESELDRHGWQRAEIPKRSRKKGNGRPIIDASRVSEWLNNNEAPRDPDILLELARIFDVRAAVVLNAAGWLPDHEIDGSEERHAVSSVADAIREDEVLVDRAKQHLLNQYELLRELSDPAATKNIKRPPTGAAQRSLRAVARKRPPRPDRP